MQPITCQTYISHNVLSLTWALAIIIQVANADGVGCEDGDVP